MALLDEVLKLQIVFCGRSRVVAFKASKDLVDALDAVAHVGSSRFFFLAF